MPGARGGGTLKGGRQGTLTIDAALLGFVRTPYSSLQVQQGGISVDKALVESLPSLTRALMERRFMSFVHTIFHFN